MLICKGQKKSKGGVGLFQISQMHKEITMWLPLQFGQEENIPGQSIECRAYQFLLEVENLNPICQMVV